MVKYHIETRQPGGSRKTQVVTSKHRWRDICEKYERKAVRGCYVRPIDNASFKFFGENGIEQKIRLMVEA